MLKSQHSASAYEYSQMNHSIKDFTEDGKCSNCGGCCSNIIVLTRQELNTLTRYVSKKKMKPHSSMPLVMATENTLDMTCPFLNSEGKCSIYHMRPMVCKTFVCNKSKAELCKDILLNTKGQRLEKVPLRELVFWQKTNIGKCYEVLYEDVEGRISPVFNEASQAE